MLKNYLKIVLRKLARQKLNSIINIAGLAVGIGSFLLIGTYIKQEFSYDNFHDNNENIYRIYRIENEPSGRTQAAATPHALPNTLRNDYPNLKNVVNIISQREDEIKSGNNKFKQKILFASPNFFDVFNFPFESGTPEQLSQNLNSIIVSKSLAAKLFGSESPLNKIVTVHGQMEFIVTGVLKDIPQNSSFQFDAFLQSNMVYRYILPEEEKKWYSMGVETYVEFSPEFSPENLKAEFPSLLKRYLPDYMQGKIELNLQPLNDIHTNTEIESFIAPAVSKQMLVIFFLIACGILGIASINFINLSTAKMTERGNEIGIRQVIGANRWQLIQQFLSESVLITLYSLVIGYFLLQLMLPYFNKFIRQPLSSDLFHQTLFIIFAFIFALLLGLINGLYPAILLSAKKPAAILRKEHNKIFGRISLRHLLVTVQFAITIALIFCVITVSEQISFMKNYNLGFISENLIVIPTNTNPTENVNEKNVTLFTEIIRNEGKKHGIISSAFSENVPGSYFPNQFELIPEGSSKDDGIEMVITRSVNEHFFDTYQMEIAKGRNFSKEMVTDYKNAAIINETTAKKFGWDNPIGKKFNFAFDKEYFTVIGVINDIHFRSLQNKIEPLVFIQRWGRKNFVTARIRSDDIQSAIVYLKQEWQKHMPAFPFEYRFVEDLYRESYKEEARLLQVISSFSILAIILASLGLLGLTALMTVQRTKEIGIRKILGASIHNIVLLMSKEVMFWIVAANIIAQPVAVYFMIQWLQDFPYRTNIGWWIFVLSSGTTLLIAIAAVSSQAIKAATANPVDSLRNE